MCQPRRRGVLPPRRAWPLRVPEGGKSVGSLPHEFVFSSGCRCRTYDELVQGCHYEWEDARVMLQGRLRAVSWPPSVVWTSSVRRLSAVRVNQATHRPITTAFHSGKAHRSRQVFVRCETYAADFHFSPSDSVCRRRCASEVEAASARNPTAAPFVGLGAWPRPVRNDRRSLAALAARQVAFKFGPIAGDAAAGFPETTMPASFVNLPRLQFAPAVFVGGHGAMPDCRRSRPG